MNTTGTIQQPVNFFYVRTLLKRARPLIVHDRFAQIKDIPLHNGKFVKFRKYNALAPNTTPLVEGVTPSGTQLTTTDITAEVKQYGDFTVVTDFVLDTSPDPVLTEASMVLGEQAADSLDAIIAAVIYNGTSVRYANGTKTSEVGSTHKMSSSLARMAIRDLERANAKPITRMVNPSTGYATTPVAPAYVVLAHPDTIYDIESDDKWRPVESYGSNPNYVQLPGEAGKLGKSRWISTTTAYIKEGEGAEGIDVYCSLFLAQDAYGVTRISGKAMQVIIKAVGSGGTTDPLNQRGTVGWKATLVAMILQQLNMVRVEHAATA